MDDETRHAIEALQARVQHLEDHIALYQAVSTYGPAVDSLQLDDAVELWAEDGAYHADGYRMEGRELIRAMLEGPVHAGLVEAGCAHSMTLPLLRIDGDRAIGLGYHRLHRQSEKGFELVRLVVSRWDWLRGAEGWKCQRRTHRLLDGNEEARQLLRDTLREIRGQIDAGDRQRGDNDDA